jgi:hypothetical protein
MVNRLENATSPYRQQHCGNRVDWWEWYEEAFTQARGSHPSVRRRVG